jgi:protein O-GlcNAc transferase
LVDCNGFGEVEGNRILDYKPAPVQAAWSNKHYTTGLPTMDWMLADASIDGVDPACFVERIHRLPCFHIDMPPGPMPPLTPPPLRRNGFVTLGAQIAGLKLNRAMMRSWARMLGRVPDARLFLRFGSIPESHDMIRSVMAAEGIGANRLSLHYGCGHERYLASFAEIDLVLDRFPISGGVTSLEALWQGVPILSWPGESWAAKRGAALLRQLGLGELVADSLELASAVAATGCKLRRGRR